KFKKIVILVLLCATLLVSLTGCMKVNMSKDKIRKRLINDSYVVSYLSKTPWTADSQTANVNIVEIMCATKKENGRVLTVYIYFCSNDKSTVWVEDKCRKNDLANETQNTIYIYDKIVMYGDYLAVSMARNY
ncbi:MAG: hypothetical protein RSA24_05735, partial [Clostridia bacterium]